MGYVSRLDTTWQNPLGTPHKFTPFAITPLWASPKSVYTPISRMDMDKCHTVAGRPYRVLLAWPGKRLAHERTPWSPFFWHDTLFQDKRDAAGLHYRRNRYLDAKTGRFTQEDPIGMAGGLNVYGFANGDAVNFSDPVGLCPYSGTTRDRNLGDCPKDDKRTEAFRLLMADRGQEGGATVDHVISNRPDCK